MRLSNSQGPESGPGDTVAFGPLITRDVFREPFVFRSERSREHFFLELPAQEAGFADLFYRRAQFALACVQLHGCPRLGAKECAWARDLLPLSPPGSPAPHGMRRHLP